MALVCLAAACGPIAGVTGGLRPPAVPVRGAYVGAWVNPNGVKGAGTPGGEAGLKEIAQLAAFTAQTGVRPAILHVYAPFAGPFPIQTLNAITRAGATPLLDWGCADVAQIAAGANDPLIAAFARQVKAFQRPLFLRWYWEMQLHGPRKAACAAAFNPAGYVAAWRRIWTIFHQAGATNAAFVWCPSGFGDVGPFYPGDGFVDWLCFDKYDRHMQGPDAFARMYLDVLRGVPRGGKPVMVGETGAPPDQQASYIAGIEHDLPIRFPEIKAVVFFDAPGQQGDWRLQGDGLAAFRRLANDSYFRFRDSP